MPGKATQDEILSLQQQVNEQSDKGELISEIKQVREESRVCTKEGNMSIEVMEEKKKNIGKSMTGQSDVINELKQEITTKKEDIENYKTSSKRERNRNESLTQKIQELSHELKVTKKDEFSSLLSLQQQVKKQSDKNMICTLTQEIKTANEDIAKYKTSVKRERNRNKPLTQKIQELSNMLKVMNVDELSVEFLSLRQELKKQSDKINQLTSEKERQQRVLTEKDAMNRNLQDEILSLQQQVNEQLDNGELISEID